MPRPGVLLLLFTVLAAPEAVRAQEEPADYRVYGEHPRLLLRKRRLRLLQRERERQSLRWQQFELLMRGGARMPEPGFAWALYSITASDARACDRAVDWALGAGNDLRQLALVFDWCQAGLAAEESRALALRIQEGIRQAAGKPGVDAVRDRVLAAIALAEHVPGVTERELWQVIERWWREQVAPALKAGRDLVSRRDTYALMEILHAIRDNTSIDLRDDAPFFFRELPQFLLVSYYPASYPAAENEYRIPAVKGGEPDLELAAMSRAAELALVAFDPNLQENQYLQGWLIHDRFLMRGTFGIPYEFLWANPYQPGVSYYHMPMAHHDPSFGRLFLRSSWEEDATWIGYFDGELQLFENGEAKILSPEKDKKPLFLNDAVVLQGPAARRFALDNPEAKLVFVTGLAPKQRYEVEVDDEEMREEATDGGGILRFTVVPRPRLGIRVRPAQSASGGGPTQ